MQEHKYSLTEIESWVPWERQVYISMLVQHLKKKADAIKNYFDNYAKKKAVAAFNTYMKTKKTKEDCQNELIKLAVKTIKIINFLR